MSLLQGFRLLFIVFVMVNGRVVEKTFNSEPSKNPSTSSASNTSQQSKQIFVGATGLEASIPDFVRLVVMRLIFGLASTLGIEERLEGALNGVFAPPNADGGFFNFGGSSGSDYGDYGDGGDVGFFDGIGDLFDYR